MLNSIVVVPLLELQKFVKIEVKEAVDAAFQLHFSPPLEVDPSPLPNLLNIDGCSKLTGLKKPSIYAHTSARTIPHYRKGKRLYFIRSEIEAWITEGKRPIKKNLLF